MSWIIGVIGNLNTGLTNKIKVIIPQNLHFIEEENLLIISGGNTKTCLLSKNQINSSASLFSGVGIKCSDEGNVFINEQYLTNLPETDINRLNGHFVLLKWDKTVLKISTDRTGLRDFYFHQLPDGEIIFSTRADWLAKLINAKINFSEFGSRWLLFNQISSNSIFEKIERITSGSILIISRLNNKIEIERCNWQPHKSNHEISPEEYYEKLNNLILFQSMGKSKISLSLSGGMDSRVMLSYLISNNDLNWDTHTFGCCDSTDSIIAQRISNDHHFLNERINLPVPDIEKLVMEIEEYESQTLVNNAASGYLQLMNYDLLANRDEVVIDGGFGEIWRREFFNRLLFRGRKSLISKNIRDIIPHLMIRRADIFNADVNKNMLKGCLEQLENIVKELPDIGKIGAENWIDLFAIKTRLVNYYSSEQTRMDMFIRSYMPFVQPVLLDNIFNVPLNLRKNGRMFKNIISQNCGGLAKYPLAKGHLTHPFWMNTIQSRVWSRVHKKIYGSPNSKAREFLLALSPFILDLVNSKAVKENEFYDTKKLSSLSQALMNKQTTDIQLHELDWWLAFELFYRQVFSNLN